MRDLVTRIDSARMSAIFAESLSTGNAVESDDFLSPRTEVSIEDVRKLRIGPGQLPAAKAKKPMVPRPVFPRVKGFGAKVKPPPPAAGGAAAPRLQPGKQLFSRSFLRSDTGDAESWLVSSPTASGGAEGPDEFLSSRLNNLAKESVLRPPSAGSDSKSSAIMDPPTSPEQNIYRPFSEDRPSSPPSSKIPRTKADTTAEEMVDSPCIKRKNSVPITLTKTEASREMFGEDEKKGSFSFFTKSWTRRRSFSSMSDAGAPQHYADSASDGVMNIPRSPSVTSLVSDLPENSELSTATQNEVANTEKSSATESITFFGRKKNFGYNSQGTGKIPVLRHKIDKGLSN